MFDFIALNERDSHGFTGMGWVGMSSSSQTSSITSTLRGGGGGSFGYSGSSTRASWPMLAPHTQHIVTTSRTRSGM